MGPDGSLSGRSRGRGQRASRLVPDLSPEQNLNRSLSRLRHGQRARRPHEASDEKPGSRQRHSSRPRTGSGEEGSTIWERRGAPGALREVVTSPRPQSPAREVVTSPRPQSPARGQSSGPPSISSVPGNVSARDVPAPPAWFGGDFVADVVQSIHSPPSSHGSPSALERLERLEAKALDVAARSPSPMRSTMPRPLRQEQWPTAPAQPPPGAARTGVIGETLTGLRRASLRLGAEAAAEVAAREHAVAGRRRASVANVKVGVLREYDAAKVARQRYEKAAPAREALDRQSSPEHDRAWRQRAAERARVAAERAAKEQAEEAEAKRRQALVDEREAGLQAALDAAAAGARRAALERAERAKARWGSAHARRMQRTVGAVGAAALRVARAEQEADAGAEEEWARVLCAEEAEDDHAIHFERRELSGDEEAEELGPVERAFGQLSPKKSPTRSSPKGGRVTLQERADGPSAREGGPAAARSGDEPKGDAPVGFAPPAPTALERLSAPEEKPKQQADEGWYQWAKLPAVAAGTGQGTAAEDGSARDGSEPSNIDLGHHRAIDPLLAPALRTATRRVVIGRDSRKQALEDSVVALAIEKYGDPARDKGKTIDWGIYRDQVFGWGLMGQHDEIVEPKAYGEFALETMDEFALDVASDAFASAALAGTNLPAVEDLFARVRSRKPPGGVSKGGELQELYELEALSEAKAHRLYDHIDNTPQPEILRVRPQSEGLFF